MAEYEIGAPPVDKTDDTPNATHEDVMGNAASKSTRSPAFQFYPRDFLSSSKVDQMSMAERGVYWTLISRCWLDEGLPTEMRELAGMVRMKTPQFEKMWTEGQLGRCFYEKSGRYQHARLDRELKAQADYRKRQSVNGAKGGRPKAVGKPDITTAFSGLSDGTGVANPLKAPLPHLLPQSSSSSSSKSAPPAPRARSGPIVQKRKLNAAWEGARSLYVLQDQHDRFVSYRNHPGATTELFAFYEQTAETFAGNIDPDMYRFWQARYAEQWPAEQKAKAPKQGPHEPDWAYKARLARTAGASA